MSRTGKLPCRICRRWFYPDQRAGDRQRASVIRAAELPAQEDPSKLARGNPGYGAVYRIDQRHRSLTEEPEPLRVAAPLNQLPWDLAKDQFGGKGADFIALACALLRRTAKDQSSAYLVDWKRVVRRPRILKPAAQHLECHQLDRRLERLRVRPQPDSGGWWRRWLKPGSKRLSSSSNKPTGIW